MSIFGQHYFIEPNIPHFKDLLSLNQTYLMKDLGMLVFNQNLTNCSIMAKASNFKLRKVQKPSNSNQQIPCLTNKHKSQRTLTISYFCQLVCTLSNISKSYLILV